MALLPVRAVPFADSHASAARRKSGGAGRLARLSWTIPLGATSPLRSSSLETRPGPRVLRPHGLAPCAGGTVRRFARISGVTKKWRSRPVSRVLSWTVIPLGATSPLRSSSLPGPDAGRVMRSLFGLAPGGVYRAVRRWPRTRCALTAPFHPYHAHPKTPFGGLLSVALAVGSRRPGITWHLALWSPDFPRHPRG